MSAVFARVYAETLLRSIPGKSASYSKNAFEAQMAVGDSVSII